jgi:hypothetical protein
MKRAIGSSKKHSAQAWSAFFQRLLGRKNAASHPVEDYVAVYGESFKLAKSWYQFGDRRVLL